MDAAADGVRSSHGYASSAAVGRQLTGVTPSLDRLPADGPMAGVLGVSNEPLVSIDYTSDPRSSTVDALSTSVMDGRMVKVLSWYDNEWGYSSRVVDLVGFVGAQL